MKNIAMSFMLAIALIATTVVLNHLYPKTDAEQFQMEAQVVADEEVINDIEFDKDGNITSETTYKWDSKADAKGKIVMRTVIYEHND